MENTKPNIFVQILTAQKITNDNIVTLSENLKDLMEKVEGIEKVLNYTEPEPTSSGFGIETI